MGALTNAPMLHQCSFTVRKGQLDVTQMVACVFARQVLLLMERVIRRKMSTIICTDSSNKVRICIIGLVTVVNYVNFGI